MGKIEIESLRENIKSVIEVVKQIDESEKSRKLA